MGKFKTKKKLTLNKMILIIIIITINVFLLLNYYGTNINEKILNISKEKLEEITINYVKKDIAPKKVVFNDLMIVKTNDKGEIIYTDINMDYAREIMVSVVGKIQDNINKLKQGKFENLNELKSNGNNIYIMVPLLISSNNVLLQNLGPKVVVNLSFYEYVFGNIETKIEEYGINNALITISLNIELEQKIIIPYTENKYKRTFSVPLGSKIINGKVPSLYGGSFNKSSSILEF